MHRERKNIRLKNWDYRSDGMYFITICTRDRTRYFGEIKNGRMIHSPAGAIANVLWYDISRNSETIDLGEFVIMPDHMHGIIIIAGSRHAVTPSAPPLNRQNRFQNIGKNSVSSIVGSYKSAVTKHCNRLEIDFGWQSRFHDHVIRNKSEFQRISKYIADNPRQWEG